MRLTGGQLRFDWDHQKKAGAEGRLIDIKDMLPNYPNISDAWDVGVISQKYLENDIDDPSFNGARYVLPTGLQVM